MALYKTWWKSAGKSKGGPPVPAGATPVAIIEVSEGNVRVREVGVGVSVPIAGIIMAGWKVYWFFKMIRERRRGGGK